MNKEAVKAARFTVFGDECRFELKEYPNKRLALQVVTTKYGEPMGMLSVNLPDVAIPDGCIAVKNYSENEAMAAAAYETGVFEETGVKAQTGFVSVPIWKIK